MMPAVGERALEFDARGCLRTGDSKLDVVMDESSWACSIPFVRWRFWRGRGSLVKARLRRACCMETALLSRGRRQAAMVRCGTNRRE